MSDECIINFSKLCKRLKLCFKASINQSEIPDLNNNPISELIQKFEDIESIQNCDYDNKMIQYVYMNKNKIHQILKNDEALIKIKKEDMNGYSDYFYLYFLIRCDKEYINYKYDFDLIQKAYEYIKDSGKIKKVLYSKIIQVFIQNFKENISNNIIDDTDNNDIIENYEKECTDIIANSKQVFEEKEINIDNNAGIEDIYISILKNLIEKDKLTNSKEIFALLDEIEIKKIKLPKTILDKILENLDVKISSFEDFTNEKKINFYYLFFSYILKNSFYIYQYENLFKTRKNIINLINSNLQEFALFLHRNENNSILKDTLSYFIEYDYYKKKAFDYARNNSNNLEDEENSNKKIFKDEDNCGFFSHESFKNKSNSMGSSIYKYSVMNDYKNELAYKIFEYSVFTLSVKYNKENGETIVKYENIKYNGNENISIEKLTEIHNDIKDANLKFNFEKFLKFLKEVENQLKSTGYRKERKIEITLKIYINNDNFEKVSCDYHIKSDSNDINVNDRDASDTNILYAREYNGLNGLYQIADIIAR